eukprot:1760807-Rhodomonas_salina.1
MGGLSKASEVLRIILARVNHPLHVRGNPAKDIQGASASSLVPGRSSLRICPLDQRMIVIHGVRVSNDVNVDGSAWVALGTRPGYL